MSDEMKDVKRLGGKTDWNEAMSKYANLAFNTDAIDALNRKAGTKGFDLPQVLAKLATATINDVPILLGKL
jgi:hypothetical protein